MTEGSMGCSLLLILRILPHCVQTRCVRLVDKQQSPNCCVLPLSGWRVTTSASIKISSVLEIVARLTVNCFFCSRSRIIFTSTGPLKVQITSKTLCRSSVRLRCLRSRYVSNCRRIAMYSFSFIPANQTNGKVNVFILIAKLRA